MTKHTARHNFPNHKSCKATSIVMKDDSSTLLLNWSDAISAIKCNNAKPDVENTTIFCAGLQSEQ
eukprot:160354-Amphidinium_carterae.1